MKKRIAAITLSVLMVGCADPAFQQYIATRQSAISGMPNGQAKFAAQEQLDQTIMLDQQRQQTQAAAAAAVVATGLAAGLSRW